MIYNNIKKAKFINRPKDSLTTRNMVGVIL